MFWVARAALFVSLACGLITMPAPRSECTPGFPSKPVRVIVTADAGGGEDTAARGFTPFLQKHLGVPVVIENMGGAGGKIAFEKFSKIKPDGYTLIFYTFPKSVIIEMTDKVGYVTRDFTPIFAISSSYNGLLVHSETWKTFDEFLKAAKTKTLKGGLSGRRSVSHLAGVLAVKELGIDVNWVPFDGAAGSLASLAGRHIDFTCGHLTSAVSLINAGKVRPLLLFGAERDPFFPDVPIPREFGYKMPSIPAVRGFEAPPGTPQEVVKVIEDACSRAIREPDYISWARNRRTSIDPMNSRDFAKLIGQVYPLVERLHVCLKE